MPGKSSARKHKGSAKPAAHSEALLQNGTQRAIVTVKISRTVRDYIAARTIQDESIDRTLRRLLRLSIPVGMFPQRSPRKICAKPTETTTVRVTKEVRDHIVSHVSWSESIDHTLRRLLKIKGNGLQIWRAT